MARATRTQRQAARAFARGFAVAITLALACASVAQAETYASRPIKMVIGFAAGGSTDLLGRLVAQKLGEALAQPVVVENRPGAGGNIATDFVAKAAPDGYTLLMGAVSNAINAALYSNLPYDQSRDLASVSMVAAMPNIVIVPANSELKSIQDLLAAAKAKPGALTFGSAGVGTSSHLTGEVFKTEAGVNILHVPYKGAAPAEANLIGGHVDMMFDSMLTALPLVQSGKLKALAVTSARRSSVAPDVPTIAEAGLPGFDVSPWYMLFAPAKTPKEIVSRVNAAIVKAMAQAEVRERLLKLGTDPWTGTPEEGDRYVREEIAKWAKAIRASGAAVN